MSVFIQAIALQTMGFHQNRKTKSLERPRKPNRDCAASYGPVQFSWDILCHGTAYFVTMNSGQPRCTGLHLSSIQTSPQIAMTNRLIY